MNRYINLLPSHEEKIQNFIQKPLIETFVTPSTTIGYIITDSVEFYSGEFQSLIGQKYKEVGGKERVYVRDDYERWLCRNDLWYLCCKLGLKEIEMYREFYEPLCHEMSLINWTLIKNNTFPRHPDMLHLEDIDIDKLSNERLYLWFRSAFKTTIQKVCMFQLLLNFPNIRIAIVHNKQENASDILLNLKEFFFNPYIKRLFGREYIDKKKDWGNRTGFSVKCRTDKTKNEDNIEAIGVDTEVTGRHYDVMMIDDIETEKSVNTEDQIKKTKDWYEYSKSLFDNPTRPIRNISGTIYHFNGLNLHLSKSKRISLSKISFEDPIVKKILWNKRFSVEGIEELKSDPWIYSCQYLLSPQDPSQYRFTDEMIKSYNTLPKNLNYYLLVDPANARKKKSDFTAMIIVGVDIKRCYYVADIIRDKIDEKERVDLAFDLIKRFEVKAVAWESIGLKDTDGYYFKERRKKCRNSFGLIEIVSHIGSKIDRIRSLIPEYMNHRWFLPPKGTLIKYCKSTGKNTDMVDEFINELLQFPLGLHDDMLDATEFIHRVNVSIPAGNPEPEIPHNSAAGIERQSRDSEIRLNDLLPRRFRKELPELSFS